MSCKLYFGFTRRKGEPGGTAILLHLLKSGRFLTLIFLITYFKTDTSETSFSSVSPAISTSSVFSFFLSPFHQPILCYSSCAFFYFSYVRITVKIKQREIKHICDFICMKFIIEISLERFKKSQKLNNICLCALVVAKSTPLSIKPFE